MVSRWNSRAPLGGRQSGRPHYTGIEMRPAPPFDCDGWPMRRLGKCDADFRTTGLSARILVDIRYQADPPNPPDNLYQSWMLHTAPSVLGSDVRRLPTAASTADVRVESRSWIIGRPNHICAQDVCQAGARFSENPPKGQWAAPRRRDATLPPILPYHPCMV